MSCQVYQKYNVECIKTDGVRDIITCLISRIVVFAQVFVEAVPKGKELLTNDTPKDASIVFRKFFDLPSFCRNSARLPQVG